MRSHSEYVIRIAAGLLLGERQLETEGNAYLWAEFVSELRLETARRLHFVWVEEVTTTLEKGK